MTKITFEVHKYTSGGRTENVDLLDFGYSSLTGARVDLDNLRKASPSDEFKLVIQGATHLPYTNADGSGAYIGLALCQSTDGPLTEGAARDEIADVTCPVCREVYEARLAEKDVEGRIAILKSAVDLAADDLLGAEKHARHYAHNDQAAPLSMTALALRTAIHAATKKALADEELLLAQYKAVR